MTQGSPQGSRYEPMPALPRLPGWLWARMGPVSRAATLATGVALVVIAVVMVPRLAELRRDNRAADRRETARVDAERMRSVRRLQRPHTVSFPHAPRATLRRDLGGAITADSMARAHTSPVRRVVCEGPPGAPPPERDRGVRRGRYACTAVTAEVANAETSGRGFTGYPYRAVVDFESGDITLCRVAGRPGEGSFVRRPVAPPAACTE